MICYIKKFPFLILILFNFATLANCVPSPLYENFTDFLSLSLSFFLFVRYFTHHTQAIIRQKNKNKIVINYIIIL